MSSALLHFRHAQCSPPIGTGRLTRNSPYRLYPRSERHACTRAEAWKGPSNVQETEQLSLLDMLKSVARQSIPVIMLLMVPTSFAEAYNVRVEDVDNPAMQAGLMAANEERWGDAERFFSIVIQQDGGASAWSNIGNVHLSQGHPEMAMEDFSHAISLAPEAAVPFLNRALAEEQLGVAAGDAAEANIHFERAIQDCNNSILRDPKEFAAYFNRGNVQMRLGLYPDALKSFQQAADLAPGIAGYRLREAQLLFENSQGEQAARMTKGVLRRNPNYAEAHVTLAAISWATGQSARAEAEYDAALEVDTRWGSLKFVRNNTRWPPRLYAAMEQFMTLSEGTTGASGVT